MSLNDFVIMKLLGKGSFGSVYLVKRKKDDQIYAMKRINLPKSPTNEKEAALNEIRLLASLSHPNIIGYKETFCDISTGDLCIVMEYGDGGDLAKRIQFNKTNHLMFEENMIWKWIIQLLNGVEFLHSHHIMHRDLKCANIFLKKDNILKIGDLNVSKLSKNSFAKTKTGTPYYLAPEVWEDRPYDYKCDIWSIGCIIYELCCLVPPFRATSLKELYRVIKTGWYLPIPKDYSNELKIVITWMLNTNPSLRKSAKEILNSDILQNKIKTGSGKALLEMISKSKQNYKFMGTIKMPINIKDLNDVLPHERYKMEMNDPFETMKKTIKLIKESKEDKSDKKQPLNNYNRELAEQIKNKNNNKNNMNNNMNNNDNNKIDIKPIIIKSEQKNNYRNKYELFNKNKNDVNIININLNANNIIKKNENNNKNIINGNKNSIKNNNIKMNESKKNSIKQDANKNNDSKQIGPNTRKKLEKQKFNEIKNEFKNNRPLSNKKNVRQMKRQQNLSNNINNKPKPRPPSGQPRYNPSYNLRLNNNINNNHNNKINNMNSNNKNSNINNNNKILQNKQKRPVSQYNNRVMINNNMNNNNIYINNNNYYYLNNNNINLNNNNNKIKKYEIKNHFYNYEGQKFDMKPYKMKANYNKMDIFKYKEENKSKFNPYLYKGNINNNNNFNYNVKYNVYYHHMKAQRERVNPAQKQKEYLFQRDGKFRKY